MSTVSEIEVIIGASGAEAVVSQLQAVQSKQQEIKQGGIDAGAGFQSMGEGAGGALGSIGDLADTLFDIPLDLAAIVGGVGAVVAAWGQLMEISEEGAGIGRIFESGALAAQAYGLDMEDVLGQLRETSLGTVSDLDLTLAASKAMMLGIGGDTEKLSQLLEIAALRGRMMGVDMTKSFNDIVLGLGRASPKILDNLGIVIDTNAAFEDYAESIGKAADELTKAEKTQAMLNAVIESSQPLLAAAGGLTVDTAGKWERMHAAKANYFNTLKVELAEATSWWADYWAGVFRERMDVRNAREIFEEVRALGLIPAELQAAYDAAMRGGQGDYKFMLDNLDEINQLTERVETFKTGTADWAEANYEGAAATAAATAAIEEQRLAFEETTAAQAAYAKIQEEIASVTSLTTNFSGMIKLAENFDKVLEQIVEQEEIMANNPIGSEKYDEAKSKVDALKQSMQDLANQVVLDMFMATIAVGGVTEAEAAAYFNMAVDMGLISREAADAAIAAYSDAIAHINGLEIDPKTGNIVFVVDTSEADNYQPKSKKLLVEAYLESGAVDGWNPPTKYGEVEYLPLGFNPVVDSNQALGGPVYPDETYLIGERGAELFVPDVPGTILSNSDYRALLSGSHTTGSLEIDYKKLGKAITDSLVEAADEGRLGNTVVVNNDGRRESVASNYELLRAYGGNF